MKANCYLTYLLKDGWSSENGRKPPCNHYNTKDWKTTHGSEEEEEEKLPKETQVV